MTPREWVGSVNNYLTSKIRIWSIYSEVFGSQHIHGALWNTLKRKSFSSSIFWTENQSSCWLSRDENQRVEKDGLLWAKSVGTFFNLEHIMFTHTCHCFSGCEAARNYPINRGLSGMKWRLKVVWLSRKWCTAQINWTKDRFAVFGDIRCRSNKNCYIAWLHDDHVYFLTCTCHNTH